MDRQHGLEMGDGSGALEKDKQDVPLDINLSGVDLNLLVVLEALLVCRNVTHAARRIGQTQPAVSRALARLRDLLGDDLLVRSSIGMKLTARGEYLAQTVPATMSHVRDVISSRQVASGPRVSINANLMPALLPHFLQSTARENEPLKVSTHKSSAEGVAQLRSRTSEYMLGPIDETSSDMESELIFSEEFVTLVAFEHHQLGGMRPAREAFLELTHINLVENGTEVFPQFAGALTSYGMRRSRLFEVPDVTSAALMVSESKLALTVPRSIAGWLTKTLRLTTLLPPIPIPELKVAMCWLAGEPNMTRRRLIDNIGAATREAIAKDQAAVRSLRSISSEA
ncbi:LysR family transcriptional regulator [Agrobacterium sp. SHOUNA12C]|nr:LysR family transcriptional regulator [Agrobacterium sp. BETTINA12B]MCJ9755132.1 LysR family transcriptional regulator [Agrobacterium sp. SHOUNA12C]